MRTDKITSNLLIIFWSIILVLGIIIIVKGFKYKWPNKNNPKYEEYQSEITPFIAFILLTIVCIILVDQIRYFLFDERNRSYLFV